MPSFRVFVSRVVLRLVSPIVWVVGIVMWPPFPVPSIISQRHGLILSSRYWAVGVRVVERQSTHAALVVHWDEGVAGLIVRRDVVNCIRDRCAHVGKCSLDCL